MQGATQILCFLPYLLLRLLWTLFVERLSWENKKLYSRPVYLDSKSYISLHETCLDQVFDKKVRAPVENSYNSYIIDQRT